jgi:hypothetical protein
MIRGIRIFTGATVLLCIAGAIVNGIHHDLQAAAFALAAALASTTVFISSFRP